VPHTQNSDVVYSKWQATVYNVKIVEG
jgi:hypothetical protein